MGLHRIYRAVYVGSIASLMIYSASMLLALLTPMLVLKGDVEGYIGLSGYSLRAFGGEVRLPIAESISLYTAPLYASSIACAALSIIAIAKPGRAEWLVFGASSIAVASAGILRGVSQVLQRIASMVSANYSHQTSAGVIIFEGTITVHGPAYIAMQIAIIAPYIAIALALIPTLVTLYLSQGSSSGQR